jgi:uncharacterized Zn finger protein
MLHLWACDECGVSNQIVVSLLTPPPDSIVRECSECGHTQEVRIPEGDPELPARQRRRKVESVIKATALTG